MIDWLFRRKKAAPQPGAARSDRAAAPAEPAAPAAPAAARPPETDWAAMLARAAGDDDALLALARGGAPIDARLAAVDAIASEDALKRAERELRKSDRRVHRRAKQRHAERIAQRETQARAVQLIANARAMQDEAPIAANRLVELDRAWRALDPALLAGAQAADFTALFERLAALERERADHALDLVRWQSSARQAGADLASACAQAAAGTIDRAALAACAAHAQTVLDAAPNDDAKGTAASRDALREVLHAAAGVATRIEIVDALSRAAPPADGETLPSPAAGRETGAEAEAEAADQAAHETTHQTTHDAARRAAHEAARRWGELAPLADGELARMLDARFAQAQHDTSSAPAPAPRAAAAAPQPDPRAQHAALARRVEQAEAALTEGRVADLGRPLSAIERQLRDAPAPPALRERIDALRAEASRLRGWQDWGGARARDELVAQAEALAAAGAGSTDAALARITTRQRADLIAELRARWKELDRHGGAAPRALWQRFDAALQTAHAPLAAQAEARRAARESNLLARIELLAALEAVALPAGNASGAACEAEPASAPAPNTAPAVAASASAPAAAFVPPPAPAPAVASAPAPPPAPLPAPEGAAASATAAESAAGAGGLHALGAAPDMRSLAVALSSFHAAWRKLGPLEHTVPHAERERLLERMNAAVARLDGPLGDARRAAHAQREELIASARALVAPGAVGGAGVAGAARGRDGIAAARALQARWQQAAQALPLARAAEAALWADFRVAIDAAYAAWNAQAAARDAEISARAEARGALIARLEQATQGVAADATHGARVLERTLAEIDAQWRDAGAAAPRAQAAALDARYRAARSAAQARLGDAARRRWQRQCEALAARLAEPDAAHAGAPAPSAEPVPAGAHADAQAGLQAEPQANARTGMQADAQTGPQGGAQAERPMPQGGAQADAHVPQGGAQADARVPQGGAQADAHVPQRGAQADARVPQRGAQAEASGPQAGAQAEPHALQAGAQAEARTRGADVPAPLPALPERWENALARRAAAPPAGAMSNDDLLLRLEAAFGFESPPELLEARRALKLHAMKAALEARRVAEPGTADALLVEALARGALDAAQRDRLRAVVAALGKTPPPGAA